MLHYAYRNASKPFSFEKDLTMIGIVLCYKGECICQFWSRPFEEEDEEIGGLGTSSVLFWLCILPTLRVLPYIETLVEQVVCL